MTNEELQRGAKILLDAVRRFYENKENMAKFNEWMKQKEEAKNV